MRVIWVIGAILLAVAAAAVWFAFQRPDFVGGLIAVAAAAAIKAALPQVTKRMPPEKEAEWRDCMRRGGEWDYRKKRCKKWSK